MNPCATCKNRFSEKCQHCLEPSPSGWFRAHLDPVEQPVTVTTVAPSYEPGCGHVCDCVEGRW